MIKHSFSRIGKHLPYLLFPSLNRGKLVLHFGKLGIVGASFKQKSLVTRKALLTYPLDDSPRLPTLHQFSDSHVLAIDTAEHKGKFGRVDAEATDIGDYALVFSP